MTATTLKVDLALVHYPVNNKNRETIISAVTNLDLHDMARAGRTFGVDNLFIVTPNSEQHKLVGEILDHWSTGHGGKVNPDRKEALSIISIKDDLAGVYEAATKKWGERPKVLATGARFQGEGVQSYELVREQIFAGQPVLILFGTAWGLAPEVMEMVDGFLPPISGQMEYNHLSVRSAASIILDRLLGKR
ncbi:MAG: RNA methyltransferase [Desulfobulbaceae bacterium]|nr:RNA methyltransferase [Desulfobulbaceae bacterium]